MIVFGVNPVLEALRSGRVEEVRVSERGGAGIREVVKAAEREHAHVRYVPPGELDRAARGGVHQGVVAKMRPAGALISSESAARISRQPGWR